MQVERYVKVEELLKSKDAKTAELNKRKELCQELGLKVQEKLSEITILSPDAFCKRISDEELKIWTIFLPTAYTDDNLAYYLYDIIPTEVLQDWKLVKDLGLFESFEIRTPEIPQPQDPILIGICRGARYLIARWGESLAPFEEISKNVEKALGLARKRISAFKIACAEHNNSLSHRMVEGCGCVSDRISFIYGGPKLSEFELSNGNEIMDAQRILATELR